MCEERKEIKPKLEVHCVFPAFGLRLQFEGNRLHLTLLFMINLVHLHINFC